MQLVDQGLIDVQDSVCLYIAECTEAWQSITTQTLLLHTTGITEYTVLTGYVDIQYSSLPAQMLVDQFKFAPLLFDPGSTWQHSNSNYALLGFMIESMSGQPYSDFIQNNILLPLGMVNSGQFANPEQLATGYAQSGVDWVPTTPVDPSVSYAAFGMYSTVADLYAWDQALYGSSLLSTDSLGEIFTSHRDTAYGGIGYGWFIDRVQTHRVIRHSGTADGFTAGMARFPDDQVTIIVLSNQQDLEVNVMIDRIARELFRVY
jgi:CubicO group peptidase (beta-lactamase class C family)